MRRKAYRRLLRLIRHLTPEQSNTLTDLLKAEIARRQYVVQLLAEWRVVSARLPSQAPQDREATRPVAITMSTD